MIARTIIIATIVSEVTCGIPQSEGPGNSDRGRVAADDQPELVHWRDIRYPCLEGTVEVCGDSHVAQAILYHSPDQSGWVEDAHIDAAIFGKVLVGHDGWAFSVADGREQGDAINVETAVLHSYPPYGPIQTTIFKRIPSQERVIVVEGRFDRYARLVLQRTYRDGGLDGMEIGYFADGKRYWTRRYSEGRRHGLMEQFAPDGRLLQRQEYANDRIVHVWEMSQKAWMQVVTNGIGRYTLFDERGLSTGWEQVEAGTVIRGGG